MDLWHQFISRKCFDAASSVETSDEYEATKQKMSRKTAIICMKILRAERSPGHPFSMRKILYGGKSAFSRAKITVFPRSFFRDSRAQKSKANVDVRVEILLQ